MTGSPHLVRKKFNRCDYKPGFHNIYSKWVICLFIIMQTARLPNKKQKQTSGLFNFRTATLGLRWPGGVCFSSPWRRCFLHVFQPWLINNGNLTSVSVIAKYKVIAVLSRKAYTLLTILTEATDASSTFLHLQQGPASKLLFSDKTERGLVKKTVSLEFLIAYSNGTLAERPIFRSNAPRLAYWWR